MFALIEAGEPGTWQELEKKVAQILRECNMEVSLQKEVQTVRGTVNVDVFASDAAPTPSATLLVECKNWHHRVPKTVVHAFRTVVADFGANTGILISSAGFQSGALDAAAYSNVRLVNWPEFQELFGVRWFDQFMLPRLRVEAEPLIEYTEPVNSRIFKKAERLSTENKAKFRELREAYFFLATYISMFAWADVAGIRRPLSLGLPMRDKLAEFLVSDPAKFPDDILDAPALRPLMDAMLNHCEKATAQFDDVFGERA